MNSGLVALDIAARINRIDVDIRAVTREFGIHEEVSPEEDSRTFSPDAL